jgi:hypothetical protein
MDMRRLISFAGLLLLAASGQVQAQHGGGHGSAGGHAGFSSHGSFGGHAAGGQAFAGTHAGSAFAPHSFARGQAMNGRSLNSRSFNGRAFAPSSVRGLNSRNFNRNNIRIRTFGFRSNCFRFPCRGYGYPWGYGAFDPYWWWDSGSSYDQDRQYQTGLANEMNQQSLDEQSMREQGDQDVYARSAPPQHQPERTEAAPATVLVFRDQRKQEIQNYAIVGQTLWNFSSQHTEKIPLSDLDVPATTKANDARGVDFRLPGSGEGQ